MERIVIVGASLAGLRAAETLRTEGFSGRVTVVGAEGHLPYDRPPLSKQVLSGAWEPERIVLRKADQMGGLDVEWRLGGAATALDLDARRIALASGDHLGFDGLVLATGTVPKRLPADVTSGVSDDGPLVAVLRTVDDSIAVRDRIRDGSARVVVVGAGFIGLEVAAVARDLGNDVTVLEGAEAPLMRGLGADMGRAVTACHGDHGVDLRCDVRVRRLTDQGVVVTEGDAGDEEMVPADVVIVGIGVRPATDWLEGSGVTLDDGVVCDETLATGIDGVVAAGDLVRWPNQLFDETMRIEHWTNAAEQGAHAAQTLLALAAGEPAAPYAPVPFFWSDQYDRRIQFLGRASDEDEVRIVSGSIEDRRFLALYGRNGRLRGALGLNSPRQVMPYRALLAARVSWNDALAHAADA